MTRKNVKSIFLTSLIGVLIWLVGTILIIVLKFENPAAVLKGWLIIVFLVTVTVSVVKNMKKDEG